MRAGSALKGSDQPVDIQGVTGRRFTVGGPQGVSADGVALMMAVFLALVAVVLGVRTGYGTMDVDEAVYRDTTVAMADGQGYYPAMRDALVRKEGAPPSQIRSVRPPTLYLFLSRFPADSWRYLVGGVYLAILLIAWRLGRPLHRYGGPIAVLLTGMWVLGAAPLLFLHTELWGAPLLMGGALAFRQGRWVVAAGALAGAAILREIYVVPLVIGLALAPRRRAFWVAIGVVGLLGLLHASLARDILAAGGREAGFGASDGLSVRYVLNAISPSDSPVGWILGLLGGTLGCLGLRSRWTDDPAARLLLVFAATIIPLTVFVGRNYWALTFGPALACYAGAAVAAYARPSTSARNLPV
jgi:hypothetical protein